MCNNVIIRTDIDKMLIQMGLDYHAVLDWWISANDHFNGETPEEYYWRGETQRIEVYNYVKQYLIAQIS